MISRPHVARRSVAAALAWAATTCGPAQPAEVARPPATTATTIPLPAGVIHEGAFFHLDVDLREKSKEWFVFWVERTIDTTGKRRVVLTAERYNDCHKDQVGPKQYVQSCALAWQVRKEIPDDAFVLDSTLETASLHVTFKGRRLDAQARQAEPPHTRVGHAGNLYSQKRLATDSVRFGNFRDRWSPKTDGQLLYRRVTTS